MNNDLKFLPEHMGDLRRIEFIYAQHNDIDKMPDLDGCEHLQELYISNNYIKSIDERFFEKLPSLKVLDVRDNKIDKLPDEIAMLQSLMRLDLSNNCITNLPSSLSTLAHLVSLQVEGNPIKSIRRDIIACGTQRILRTLRDRDKGQVHVNSATIVENVYPNKFQLKNTKILTISGKNFSEIPTQVFEDAVEAEITIVDLSKNKFTQLPEGLSHLRFKLTELHMNANQMIKIQPFISQFHHIMYMNLNCNHLLELPNELGQLEKLREINIGNNRFESVPKCIYNLGNLEILIACNNKIEEIDASENALGALKRLATLDLSNNNLKHVPSILGNMTQLTSILLHGNCFRSPRNQILAKGTASILCYLRDRIPKKF